MRRFAGVLDRVSIAHPRRRFLGAAALLTTGASRGLVEAGGSGAPQVETRFSGLMFGHEYIPGTGFGVTGRLDNALTRKLLGGGIDPADPDPSEFDGYVVDYLLSGPDGVDIPRYAFLFVRVDEFPGALPEGSRYRLLTETSVYSERRNLIETQIVALDGGTATPAPGGNETA
jgi:hypothetical protein